MPVHDQLPGPLIRETRAGISFTTSLLILLAAVCTAGDTGRCADVEFLVGDYLPEEGGTWDPVSSPLNRPFGVAFDSHQRMFIVELEGGRVFRRDPDGMLHQVSGDGSRSYTGDGGPSEHATYNGMHNCAITADDRLLIADTWNHCVRRIDLQSGLITTLAGTGEKGFAGDVGPGTAARFDFVMCITLSPSGDALHIADLNNHRIRKLEMATGMVSTVAGNGERGVPLDGAVAAESPLVDPRAVAADASGNVYVLERNGNALRVMSPDGRIRTVAGSGRKGFQDGPALQAEFGSPKHICIDDRGRVFIADDLNGAVRLLDPTTGQVTTVLGRGFGDARIRLKNPHGVAWHDGRLIVVDSSHNRILRLAVGD